jgi:hypothetical protein
VPAAANITGSSPSQLLHLTLPKGNTGTAATIAVGTTATGAAGSSASVTNGGSSSAAVFNFTIPKGDKGNTGTLSLGTVATGNAGTDVIITNTGTPEAAEFNFTIPRGNTGANGPATELSVVSTSTGEAGSEASVTIIGDAPVQSLAFTIPRGDTGETGTAATITAGTTTTGAAGSNASVTNVGTNSAAVFDFTIPRGDTGQTGPATQLSVASTTTGAAGTNASVTISGAAPNQSLAFTIPTGPQGPQGPTGSSGATALLTGYVSGAGTVAATDTVIQAVGKLNGNDELKAPIASLYPYIGGKLLTYLDEEAAIADPLISAGDIYRKTAGGVDYVNPDNVPSLDLRFATDKTLTARRGPTPTFSRASGATYIGSDGLIHGIDTSTTSNTIGTGSRTFTLAATLGQDQFWRAGDAVDASNGLNIMTGTVTSYDAATQSLVCNMTTVSGTGTFTSWRIGYRGPRFDHDPVTLACKGLLIEEGRTNLVTRSQEFSNWSFQNSTLGSSATAPDGNSTANSVAFQNSTSPPATVYSSMARLVSVSVTAGQQYTVSFYVKASTNTSINIGTNGQTSPGNNSGALVNVTTSWTRVSFTLTAGGNDSGLYAVIGSGFNGVSTYLSARTIEIWGAQLEAGSFPTSYIPTTTGTLARSADLCSIAGANFTSFYNQSEGTLFADATPQTVDQIASVLGVNTTTYFDSHIISKLRRDFNGAGRRWGAQTVSTGAQTAIATTTDVAVSRARLAYAFKLNDFAFAYAGSIVGTDDSGTIPTPTTMRIGSRDDGLHINGHLASIRYYKKRLPNAKLAQLTA